jgi:SAM-dependent methyltransferase
MSSDPLNDVVSSQYERWMYPEPIVDLPLWLQDNWQWFDPSHAHRLFWPDRNYKPDLDILIAGCGTNQAAVFAYTNPQSSVVAIDVSQPSLGHHKQLKETYGLKNLELHHLPIEAVASLNRRFDLIVSTGVLHHLEEPEQGLRALASCLQPEGVAAIMLYAKYGRIGVEMLQGVFRELDLRQNEASVLMVREALTLLPQDHPVMAYLAVANDLQGDAGLVDTFLHGRDRSYSIADCLTLVEAAGLRFQDLFFKAPYSPPAFSNRAFHAAITSLPDQQRWSLMERLNHRNGCHFFSACRSDRPEKNYRIDFNGAAAMDYVPGWRYRCECNGTQVISPYGSINLDPVQLALLQLVDGHRTIREIGGDAVESGVLPKRGLADLEQLALTVLQTFWQLDVLSIALERTEAIHSKGA